MHSIKLERRLRLPDPVKALEGVWKIVRGTRQQLNVTPGISRTVSRPDWRTVEARKLAKIDAERRKAAAVSSAYRSTFR